MYYKPADDPVKLEMFKGYDEDRDEQKEERMVKQYMRDEL